MGKTFAEKALGRAAGLTDVSENDIVIAYPDFCMSHENSASILKTFQSIGREKVYDRERIVIAFDHTVPPSAAGYANNQKAIQAFVQEQQITHCYDMTSCGGICHQIMCQEGFALPGLLTVGADSHTCTHGAFGSFSTGIGRSEMAAIWATGKMWMRVPQSMKIIVEGTFRPGVSAKDLILTIIRDIGAAGADYLSVEFHGDGIGRMSLSERMTLCNMGIEMGAKNAVCRPDQKVFDYIKGRAKKQDWEIIWADEDANYVRCLHYRLEEIVPMVALPHTVDNGAAVSEVQGRKVDQVFIGACTNGRLEDLRAAARILKGNHVKVRTIVTPASVAVYLDAMREGVLGALMEAGCVVNHPGCGLCVGVVGGILADGDTCISTSNRNFKGRMGNPKADIILASPVTAAYSALRGEVYNPAGEVVS